MQSILLIAIALSTLFLTGCPKSKPNVPPAIANRIANYEIARLANDLEDYDCASLGFISDSNKGDNSASGGKGRSSGGCGSISKDDAVARRIRDRVINRLKANIDANYQDFENQLFTGRARTNILFDTIEIGAAVATNITNGERAKNILSVALAGFKAGRTSIDENLFRDRTTQVIISQMQASRARLETNIIKNKRDNGVDQYPLEEALGDLINYFYAGSLQKGLQELAKEAGQNAIRAEAQKEFEKARGGVTTTQATKAFEINERIEQLSKDVFTAPISLDKQAEALKIVRKAIQELTGQAAPADDPPSKLFESLKAAMRAAAKKDADEGTARIRKALGLPE
jgi:hypothetical protein